MDGPRLSVLGAIFSVGLLLVIVIGLSSGEPTGYAIFKSSLTKTGTLYVSSNPKSANVYMDNVYKGITPTTISLSIGNHDVKVTKSGYNDYISTVTISSGTTTNFDVTLPQSKLGTKTASPTQVGDIPSPYPPERQQDIRKKSNATEQPTATLYEPDEPEIRGTVAPPAKSARWYAVYPYMPFAGYVYHYSIATLNLGSPVRICTSFKPSFQFGDRYYASGCSGLVGSYEVGLFYGDDRTCDEYSEFGGNPQVPCDGYITVYSEDGRQPILPSGLLCRSILDQPSLAPVCTSLHFVPRSDIIE